MSRLHCPCARPPIEPGCGAHDAGRHVRVLTREPVLRDPNLTLTLSLTLTQVRVSQWEACAARRSRDVHTRRV